jgi:hypothetical protein
MKSSANMALELWLLRIREEFFEKKEPLMLKLAKFREKLIGISGYYASDRQMMERRPD